MADADPAATTEDDAVAAVLLDAGDPVVEAVEDDPAVAGAALADTTADALATEGTPTARGRRGRGRRASARRRPRRAARRRPDRARPPPRPLPPLPDAPVQDAREDDDAPAPRARRRRAPAVVTFVAPDEVPPAARAPPGRPRSRRTPPTPPPPTTPPPPGAAVVPAPPVRPPPPTCCPRCSPPRTPPRRPTGPDRLSRTTTTRTATVPAGAVAAAAAAARAARTPSRAPSPTTRPPRRATPRPRAPRTTTRRRPTAPAVAGAAAVARGAGGDDETTAEDDVATVVHVREPRQRATRGTTAADEDGVRGITGSTRMAAKRVRRQEGRDSGRGRKAILTEAEFLARREAVQRDMVVRQKGDVTQIAVLEDGILVEHYVTKASAEAYAGNVYLGRVQNVLPSMEAAFVDIGKGRNGVLYAGEVNYEGGSKARSIESVLKSGQEVLVQVSKDPIGHKGARLTSQVSLPGRYLVYVPEGSMTGISRKLPENERSRLKSILKKVVPDTAGVIIRTAAEGASEEEIAADVRRLQAQWEVIQEKAKGGGAPKVLQAEPDLVVRVVRDVFNEDFASLVVQGDTEWDTIRDYVEFVAPDLAPRVRRHVGNADVFAEHRIDEQLLKALDRKVHLPSGGSLVIDRTEAMVVIDVNTGKYVGKGGNLEETVTRNNLEAAEEIARQLRLRDLGGIIVVDFIDMVLESNRDLVVRRLVECLGRDRTKHQVAEVTSLGLVQMTRKRVGQGLLESFSEPCDSCGGRGVHVRLDVAGSPVGPRSTDGGAGIERVAKAAKVAKAERARGAGRRLVRGRRRAAGRGRAQAAPSRRSRTRHVDRGAPGRDERAARRARRQRGPARAARRRAADADRPRGRRRRGRAGHGGGGPGRRQRAGRPRGRRPGGRRPDLVPDLAEQPTAAMEDLPVVPDVVQSVVEPEPADAATPRRRRGARRGHPGAGAVPPADLVEFGHEPEVEARPRRRRRATSRPAGPAEQ